MIRFICLAFLLLALGGCAGGPPPLEKAPPSDVANIYLTMGTRYAEDRHFDWALEKLKKAIEYAPDRADAHNAIAVVYQELGDKQLAAQHYRRAVELDPDYALARMNYGWFLCADGRPAEGESELLAAAANPKLGAPENAYLGAARCALAIPDRERAEAHLRKALEVGPEATQALYQLADLSYAEGKYLQARAFLQRFHAKAGYSPQSLRLAISIEQALGDQRQRREYTTLLMSKFADSDQARQLKKSE